MNIMIILLYFFIFLTLKHNVYHEQLKEDRVLLHAFFFFESCPEIQADSSRQFETTRAYC